MRTLLAGNGINMQFEPDAYSRQQIVLRLLQNLDRDDFPKHIIIDTPFQLKCYLGKLFLESRNIIQGEYDRYVTCLAEQASLDELKDRYKSILPSLRMTDIGFEDYYLLHDLVCHKYKTNNPEQYIIRECMRMTYLLSIYNSGNLNKIFTLFSPCFTEYLSNFDTIYTVNYDSNIESATNKEVIHLHGQFDILDNVYNSDSIRNHMKDAPLESIELDADYIFLYSNAISTHCGAYKELQIKQASAANEVLEKMRIGYENDPVVRNSVIEWSLDDNPVLSNLGNAIQVKVNNPDLCFFDNYQFSLLESMSGKLEILGFSPWNDLHIFEAIDCSDIDECIFYFHSDTAQDQIQRALPRLHQSKRLKCLSTYDFWENLN